jgi:hypothetical protein
MTGFVWPLLILKHYLLKHRRLKMPVQLELIIFSGSEKYGCAGLRTHWG